MLNERINPGGPIPAEATAVHHIGDTDVQDAESWRDVSRRVLALCENHLLIAYNLTFDWQILARAAKTFHGRDLVFFGLDPYIIVRHLDKYEKGKKLEDACRRRKIPTPNAHDAAGDVIAMGKLTPMLLHELGARLQRHEAVRVLSSQEAMWEWTVQNAIMQDKDLSRYLLSQRKPAFESRWEKLCL